jgi:hypothetical protein
MSVAIEVKRKVGRPSSNPDEKTALFTIRLSSKERKALDDYAEQLEQKLDIGHISRSALVKNAIKKFITPSV